MYVYLGLTEIPFSIIDMCQVRDEAPDLIDDVIMCCLVRTIAYLRGGA
jgi:hypothetical protein